MQTAIRCRKCNFWQPSWLPGHCWRVCQDFRWSLYEFIEFKGPRYAWIVINISLLPTWSMLVYSPNHWCNNEFLLIIWIRWSPGRLWWSMNISKVIPNKCKWNIHTILYDSQALFFDALRFPLKFRCLTGAANKNFLTNLNQGMPLLEGSSGPPSVYWRLTGTLEFNSIDGLCGWVGVMLQLSWKIHSWNTGINLLNSGIFKFSFMCLVEELKQ